MSKEFELSLLQAPFWLGHQMEPDSPAPIAVTASRIRHAVDGEILRTAWREFRDRHGALRTTFHGTGAGVQRRHDVGALDPQFELRDVSGISEQELLARVVADVRRPFDLSRQSPVRASLYRRGPEDSVLLLATHHIGFDYPSADVMHDELFKLYASRVRGAPPELAPPPEASYEEFVAREQQMLQGARGEELRAFWRDHLSGVNGVLSLPIDRRRQGPRRRRGESYTFPISRELTKRVNDLSARAETTLFRTLFTAYSVLLFRYSRQEDFVVATPADARPPAFEGVVGDFMNVLPVRVGLSSKQTFADALRSLHRAISRAGKHRDLPLVSIMELVDVVRDPTRTPLYQVNFRINRSRRIPEMAAFGIRGAPWRATVEGVALEAVPVAMLEGQLDLQLALAEVEDQLYFELKYAPDVFDLTTIQGISRAFVSLLESVTARPEARLDSIALADEEVATATARRNATDRTLAPAKTVHRLFDEQAERTPDAPAVASRGESIDYRELSRRAGGVARALVGAGVRRGDRVAIVFERSIDMISALLGVLKVGAAYVPIDWRNPPNRIRYIVEDSGAKAILTQHALAARLGEHRVPLVRIEDARIEDARIEDSREVEPATIEDVAYVIYTSGSTGLPKGVAVPHRSLVNYAFSICQLLETPIGGANVPLRFAHVSTLAADLGNTCIFPALLSGGALHVIPEAMAMDGERFGSYARSFGIDVLKITPSHLGALLAFPGGDGVLPSSVLFTGGEACSWKLVDEVRRVRPDLRWINHYGPTETTVGSLTFDLDDAASARARCETVPIGRPIGNTEVYVLDDLGQEVPPGMPGEVCIAGDGVTHGYLGRPSLTAERFVPNPVPGARSSRMYRTGDLGRLLDGGAIEFLGRIDHQVKVRGFRIELQEVEAVIRNHGAAREVAVVLHTRDGQADLTAFVVPASASFELEVLRAHLRAELPDYAVPHDVRVMQALPLSSNGKVDRGALVALAGLAPREDAAASTATEPEVALDGPGEALRAIWRDLLKVDRLGLDDNFFALGGNSFLAMRSVSRARQAGLNITVEALFRLPTIRELAAVATFGAAAEAPPTDGAEGKAATPWQRAILEAEQKDDGAIVVLDLGAHVSPSAVERAFRAVVAHHGALRHRFVRAGGEWEQREVEPPPLAIPRLDLAARADASAALDACCEELRASLDAGQGVLVRAAHITFGPERKDKLAIVLHDLVADDRSWHVLLADLTSACQAEDAGTSIGLSATGSSFGSWIQAIGALPRAGADDASAEAIVPIDHERVEGALNSFASARTATFELDPAETRTLLRQVPATYGADILETVLASLAESLCEWANTEALTVDVVRDGRTLVNDRASLGRTIGCFSVVAPVRLERVVGGAGAILLGARDARRRYLDTLADASSSAPIRLHYLGHVEPRSGGLPRVRPDRIRPCLVEIRASIVARRLTLEWTFSEDFHRESTIAAVGARTLSALRAIALHCGSANAGGYAPADFPLARLDQTSLDRVLSGLDVRGRGEIEDIYPLSPTQQGMLFHSLYTPESDVYAHASFFVHGGELDAVAWRRAWQRVVDRHALLRTAFAWGGPGDPLQIVFRHVAVPFSFHDWSALSEREVGPRLEDLTEGRVRELDLRTRRLFRLDLVRLPQDRYGFLMAHHHMLLDQWSGEMLMAEAIAAYASFRRNEEPSGAPTFRYRDYVEWVSAQEISAADAYWSRTLGGFSEPTPLLGDRAPGGPVGAPATLRRALSSERTRTLEALARRRNLTLSTILQGAWALVLGLTSGRDDVVFGVTTTGRPPELSGIESAIGLFIATTPLRATVSGDQEIAHFLEQLQIARLEARRYEWAPLVRIQGASAVPKGTPLFESLLIFNYTMKPEGDRDGGPRFTLDETLGRSGTNYPLVLVVPAGETLSLVVHYEPTRFDEAAAGRLLDHLDAVLDRIAASPDGRIDEVSLLSERERRDVLETWNDTRTEYPGATCIHELFEEQARRTPGAVAVDSENERVSYRELDERAERIATWLVSRGAAPGHRVALSLSRTPSLVAAVLAVLKTGAAYVPIDPHFPEDRKQLMRSDARCVAELDDEALALALATPARPRAVKVADSDVAYVLYTSGSTGRPKGVVVPHSAVVNFLRSMAERPGISAADVLVAVTTLSFDIAGLELFLPLSVGAKIVIASQAVASDASQLAALLRRSSPTIMQATPATWRMLLVAGFCPPPTLKVLCGGEAATSDLVAALTAQGATVWNMYGPTETTIWSTCEELRAGAPITVGRPIANTRLYVLDDRRRLLPPGVVGELFIGGAGVAYGYLGRPELTAEKFVTDPFAAEPGQRLYATGDRARWVDGRIEVLGRVDHQVKVRGFRIEPGEIESTLREYGGVREALVVAREDAPGDKRLVAYLVFERGNADDLSRSPAALREHAKRTLPEYMIPSVFVALDELPRTPNGKIDRAALPAPDFKPNAERVAPRTEIERTLAAAWSEVLRVPEIGVFDHFFEVGGDSILAIQVIARARAGGVDVTLQELFQYSTIRELAAVARTVDDGTVSGVVSMTPLQRWFVDTHATEPHHFNHARLLATSEALDPSVLRATWSALRRYHDALRHRFRRTESGTEQIADEPTADVLEGGFDHVDLADLVGEDEAAQRAAIEQRCGEAQRTLDLRDGPIARMVHFDLGPSRGSRLLVVVHQLVFDDASWSILLGDLVAVYRQLAAGEQATLPPKTTSFQAWARSFESSPMPTPAAPATSGALTSLILVVSAEEAAALVRETSAVGVRSSDVLLAALAASIDAPVVQVDVETSERATADVARTIGWFSRFTALRLAGGACGPADALARVEAAKHGTSAAFDDEAARASGDGLLFRDLGTIDAAVPPPFTPASESVGLSRSARAPRTHAIEIEARIEGGALHVGFQYVEALHERAAIQALADRFRAALSEIVAHCLSSAKAGPRAEDFELAGLDQAQLDELLETIDEEST